MGRRRAQQDSLWVAKSVVPTNPGHPFNRQLDIILDAAGFDAHVEEQCREAPTTRPSRALRSSFDMEDMDDMGAFVAA